MEFSENPFVRYISKTSYYIPQKFVIARDCRFLYVLSGNGNFESEGKKYQLTPGAFVYYPYGVPYKISSKKRSPLHFYTVNFDFNEQFTDHTMMVPEPLQLHNSKKELRSINNALADSFSKIIFVQDATAMENNFRMIYKEAQNKKPGHQQLQSSYLKIILIYLYRKTIETTGNPLCEKIKELVSKNPKLNNEALAKMTNYHPFYLNEIFKKSEGITLHKFTMQIRLTKAHELLTSTQLSLEEIAFESGFSSQSHFSTSFKKEYNISPGQIRRLT